MRHREKHGTDYFVDKAQTAGKCTRKKIILTKEKNKKEKYVKGMKKFKSDFEKRYGKDAQAVMYAQQLKMAKEQKIKSHCESKTA